MLSNSTDAWCTIPTEPYLHVFTEPTSCQTPGSCTKYSGLGFFVSQCTVKSKNRFSTHASIRCGGRPFSFCYVAVFIYLFWTPPLITNHKWCNWTLSLAFLHSLYFSPISHMWFPTYHFWGLTRSKGKFFLKAKQAKTFQVTYVTPSSWCFPLPLTFTEIAESRGNKNAWFMKHFNYVHTPHSP